MKIIAIESSGLVASVAIMTEDNMIAEYTVNHKKTHSQTLLPMLDVIVKMAELEMKDIDAIAVSSGPGSFTGLRIGSATAKGLGFALDKPLIEVPTLDSLAYNLYGCGDAVICPLMDARRDEVYTGLYEFSSVTGEDVQTKTMSETEESKECNIERPVINHEFRIITPQKAVPLLEIIDEINTLARRVIYLGDGVPVYRDMICKNTRVEYSFAPKHLALQRAGAVGALAYEYIRQGRLVSAADHVPTYLRVSQAERMSGQDITERK